MNRFTTPRQLQIATELQRTLSGSALDPMYPPGSLESFIINLTEDRLILGGLFPLGPDLVTLSLRATVARGCRLEPELLAMLLKANCALGLGAFGIDFGEPDIPGDGIVFEVSMLANDCTLEQLETAVGVILSVAEDYESKIVSSFGGHGPLGF